MRILVVGAGAVGQVYGHLAALGGAEVSVYVRPGRRAEARAGYEIVRVPLFGARRRERFEPVGVLTSAAELAAAPSFDALWCCVATPALEDAWVRALAEASGKATFLSFQPGLGVRERLAAHFAAERLLTRTIPFVAGHSPLPGSRDPREQLEGMSVLFPPGAQARLSGASERRVLEQITLLRRGGLDAALSRAAEADGAAGTAVLMPMVACLELADWKLAKLGEPEHASRFRSAAHEALAVTSHETGRDLPPLDLLIQPPLLRLAAVLGPRVMPLDLETYLEVHFSKVGDQTVKVIDDLIGRAVAASLPCGALRDLAARLATRRRASEAE